MLLYVERLHSNVRVKRPSVYVAISFGALQYALRLSRVSVSWYRGTQREKAAQSVEESGRGSGTVLRMVPLSSREEKVDGSCCAPTPRWKSAQPIEWARPSEQSEVANPRVRPIGRSRPGTVHKRKEALRPAMLILRVQQIEAGGKSLAGRIRVCRANRLGSCVGMPLLHGC